MDHTLILIELQREKSCPNVQIFLGLLGVKSSEVSLDDLADRCDAVIPAVSVGLLLFRSLGDFDSI